MRWAEVVDNYCERLGPGFWAEPFNAVSNAAFLIAALLVWRRTAFLPEARVLTVILGIIGIGSFLFHTFATRWAGLADVLPIGLYILTYIWAANRHFWLWPGWAAALGAAAFIPYAALVTPVFDALPFFTISSFYWSVPLLIAAYALALRHRLPVVAAGLGQGAAILCASLVARSLDDPLCSALPLGTHFLWHILNALMLAHMILVLVRHRLEAGRPAG
jgi:hypothetical protein